MARRAEPPPPNDFRDLIGLTPPPPPLKGHVIHVPPLIMSCTRPDVWQFIIVIACAGTIVFMEDFRFYFNFYNNLEK